MPRCFGRVGVGAGQADAPPGELRVARPHLLAGDSSQPPSTGVGPRCASDARSLPGVGLAEQLAPDLARRRGSRQPALLLLVGAVGEQRRAGQVDADPVHRLRRTGPGVLHVEERDLTGVAPRPPYSARPADARPSGRRPAGPASAGPTRSRRRATSNAGRQLRGWSAQPRRGPRSANACSSAVNDRSTGSEVPEPFAAGGVERGRAARPRRPR